MVCENTSTPYYPETIRAFTVPLVGSEAFKHSLARGGLTGFTGGTMQNSIIGNKFRLSGNWTISGVESQLDSLSHSLIKLDSTSKELVQVDCEQINAIDMSGVQLIHVWMECASERGIHMKLINLPDIMQQTMQQLGFGKCLTDNYPEAA